MEPKELKIDIPSGYVMGLAWGQPSNPPLLCLHGWLDNANSFTFLAPLIEHYYIVAIDLPGHGHSSHRPHGAYFHISDYIPETVAIVDALEWPSFGFLCHSLGASVASLVAGVIPQRITAIVLLDALGPFATPAEKIPGVIRKSISDYKGLESKQVPIYKSKQEACTARLKATPMAPASVERLIERSLKPQDDGTFTWRNDKRLILTPMVMLTEEQVEAFLKLITAPICLIRPDNGWPFGEEIFKSRTQLLKDLEIHHVPGHHHVHMDDAASLLPIIQSFFDQRIKI